MEFVTANVDARKAMRKVLTLEARIYRRGNASVADLAVSGRAWAQRIAPHNTGNLAAFIKVFSDNNGKARIVANNPTAGGRNRLSTGQYPNFNLVRWMHQTGGVFQTDNAWVTLWRGSSVGRTWIRSGDPKFMYTTRSYLNRIKKGVATGRYKTITLE